MRSLTLGAALLTVGFFAVPDAAEAQEFCSGDRVMGGCAVSISDFPWMVSLNQANARSLVTVDGAPGEGQLTHHTVTDDPW